MAYDYEDMLKLLPITFAFWEWGDVIDRDVQPGVEQDRQWLEES